MGALGKDRRAGAGFVLGDFKQGYKFPISETNTSDIGKNAIYIQISSINKRIIYRRGPLGERRSNLQ